MVPDIAMLRGMAIQDDSGTQPMLKHFDLHQLPSDPAARFRAVFQEQPQWTLKALQAYIEDLQVQSPVIVAAFLLQDLQVYLLVFTPHSCCRHSNAKVIVALALVTNEQCWKQCFCGTSHCMCTWMKEALRVCCAWALR